MAPGAAPGNTNRCLLAGQQAQQPCTQPGSPFPLPKTCLRADGWSHLPIALGLPRCCRRAGALQTSSATILSPCTWCAHTCLCCLLPSIAANSLWSAWFGLSPSECGDTPSTHGHWHGAPLLAAISVSAGCLVCLVSFRGASAVASHQRDSWQIGRPGVPWVLETVFFQVGIADVPPNSTWLGRLVDGGWHAPLASHPGRRGRILDASAQTAQRGAAARG